MEIGSPIIAFETLDSTNKTAAELLELSKVQHGAVILAREQTSGRGQRGRSWVSQPGADLTFSVVIQPTSLRSEDHFLLGMISALAVHTVVQELVKKEVRIKWPNDILVERRKVAGILVKNEVLGELLMSSILGIGLNVNSAGLPDALVATSLLQECGRTTDLDVLLSRLCAALEQWWQAWRTDAALVQSAYREALWARGRWAEFVLDDRSVKARAMDVDRFGRLIVEMEGGGVATYGLDRLRFAPR